MAWRSFTTTREPRKIVCKIFFFPLFTCMWMSLSCITNFPSSVSLFCSSFKQKCICAPNKINRLHLHSASFVKRTKETWPCIQMTHDIWRIGLFKLFPRFLLHTCIKRFKMLMKWWNSVTTLAATQWGFQFFIEKYTNFTIDNNMILIHNAAMIYYVAITSMISWSSIR